MENLISNMGMGQKQMAERYADYPASHDQHFYYTYEPASPSHGHASPSKHHYSGSGGHKSNAAMSALTLLAFLFFLHILQGCLKDHMSAMSTPPVVIMSAKEGNEHIGKTSHIKLDKTGVTKIDTTETDAKVNDQKIDSTDSFEDENFMRIPTSEHRFSNTHKFKNIYKHDGLKSPFSDFASAMDEE